jgi:hypothetical protein
MTKDNKLAIRVLSVKHPGAYALHMRWSNGKEFTVDLHELVFRLKGLRPLREANVFARACSR